MTLPFPPPEPRRRRTDAPAAPVLHEHLETYRRSEVVALMAAPQAVFLVDIESGTPLLALALGFGLVGILLSAWRN